MQRGLQQEQPQEGQGLYQGQHHTQIQPQIHPSDAQPSMEATAEPYWSPDGKHLLVTLPEGCALHSCRGVQIELVDQQGEGVLLPLGCTCSLGLQEVETSQEQPNSGSSTWYAVTGVSTVEALIDGAHLLPCTAVHGKQGQWNLVVRASWPVKTLGLQVGW
jgi:hypothetical protein